MRLGLALRQFKTKSEIAAAMGATISAINLRVKRRGCRETLKSWHAKPWSLADVDKFRPKGDAYRPEMVSAAARAVKEYDPALVCRVVEPIKLLKKQKKKSESEIRCERILGYGLSLFEIYERHREDYDWLVKHYHAKAQILMEEPDVRQFASLCTNRSQFSATFPTARKMADRLDITDEIFPKVVHRKGTPMSDRDSRPVPMPEYSFL